MGAYGQIFEKRIGFIKLLLTYTFEKTTFYPQIINLGFYVRFVQGGIVVEGVGTSRSCSIYLGLISCREFST